ncbi:N-terminal C2 in EEIG1 and EHBP1 proteins-domain-containing protein [Calycina marina]|uniref:N-terminal C2 in EEIG1 and EHBP1 proteins-domain-containing protein n=1 Tax=Calycina marina TaxID=1763456 RepID=A0A9P7YYS1_9HELO|nr:N-terminal C2 in EEIG1 and EHBP1 proteins-domain-containing protein [Calycina marina]
MNPLIPKGRKPKFELVLKIYDLNNVPLVAGTSHVRWHLPSSTSVEHRGHTATSSIKDNKVTWEYSKTLTVRIVVDKSNNLTETLLQFEVIQDYSAGGRGEKIMLGELKLNLAEYVDESESADCEDGVVRRYLMQESKINSTLKIGIAMKQIEGDRNFVAPPLKTVPVFGGIAGIMAGDSAKQDDQGAAMPTISKGGDFNDLQDLYRQSISASLAAPAGEYTAEECIEDIFNGGDGWKGGWASTQSKSKPKTKQTDHTAYHFHRHSRHNSEISLKSQSTVKGPSRFGHKHSSSQDMRHNSGISTLRDPLSSESSDSWRGGFRPALGVNEFDMREDLASWKMPTMNT